MASMSFGSSNSGLQVGVNHGPIYAAAEQAGLSPKPLSTVPFRRDPDFVDRGILDQIDEKNAVDASRIALVGLGGVGKSQIAIEYCYRVRDQSPDTWVLWLHASNITRFDQSCRHAADRLQIPHRNSPQANILQLLHDWLQDERNKWLLILDNVDDDQFLHEIPSMEQGARGWPVREYFPQGSNGSVIITSRYKLAVSSMVEDSDIIAIDPMDEAHAIVLFEKKLGARGEVSQELKQLIAALDFMPLAIVQAAAYIRHRSPRVSVAQYLRTFEESDRRKINLLVEHEAGHLRRDTEANNSILATWHISFDHIQRTMPTAADLLSLFSFFDRQGIPADMLKEHLIAERQDSASQDLKRGDGCGVEVSDVAVEFENDIVVLRDYLFISISTTGSDVEMHRLVQISMQEWLKSHNTFQDWKEQFILYLSAIFPETEIENWRLCQYLFAHIYRAVSQYPEFLSQEWTRVLMQTSSFAYFRGHDEKGFEVVEKAFEAAKSLFGLQDRRTLKIMSQLSSAYDAKCHQEKAKELFMEMIEIQERVFGLDDPSTLERMNDLADYYMDKEQDQEAEELLIRILEIQERVLGQEHTDTLVTLREQARHYFHQKRWKEAEERCIQVIKAVTKALGPGHSEIIHSMVILARVYSAQNRLQEAAEIQMPLIEVARRAFGPEHPVTLDVIMSLAYNLISMGQVESSKQLVGECVRLCGRLLGPGHFITTACTSRLVKWFNK
ncbi:unnamed protein product [Penicillium pancosmium]